MASAAEPVVKRQVSPDSAKRSAVKKKKKKKGIGAAKDKDEQWTKKLRTSNKKKKNVKADVDEPQQKQVWIVLALKQRRLITEISAQIFFIDFFFPVASNDLWFLTRWAAKNSFSGWWYRHVVGVSAESLGARVTRWDAKRLRTF